MAPLSTYSRCGNPRRTIACLEHRQEGGGVLRQGKGGVGHDPGGIVDEGDQVGLALGTIAHQDARPVHHIAHPHLPGLGEGEAAPILIARVVLGFVHQAMAGQQAMHGGGRQRQFWGHLGALARLADDQLHRQLGVALLERASSASTAAAGKARARPRSARSLGNKASKPPRR